MNAYFSAGKTEAVSNKSRPRELLVYGIPASEASVGKISTCEQTSLILCGFNNPGA
jgi:hypothetical protein